MEPIAVGQRRAGPGVKRARLTYGRQVAQTGLLMIAPVVLLIAVFTLYPFAYAFYTSTQLSIPMLPPKFVGFDNYVEVFTSPYFGDAVRVTITFAGLATPLLVVLSLLSSLLLNEPFRGNTLMRAGMLLPWAIPASATGVIWKWLFLDSWGAINAIMFSAGIIQKYISWLTSPELAVGIVVLAFAWAQLPLATILLLAALQSVPDDLYEAAAIDGAGVLGRFRYVTFPEIATTLLIVTLYELLMGLTNFDVPFSLTRGGPGTATTVVSYFTWSESFKMANSGHGTALAIMIALTALAFIFAILRLLPKGVLGGPR